MILRNIKYDFSDIFFFVGTVNSILKNSNSLNTLMISQPIEKYHQGS